MAEIPRENGEAGEDSCRAPGRCGLALAKAGVERQAGERQTVRTGRRAPGRCGSSVRLLRIERQAVEDTLPRWLSAIGLRRDA